MRQHRVSVIGLLSLVVIGCASATQSNSARPAVNDNYAHLKAAFEEQAECRAAWNKLLTDWKANGGGIRESITSTRKQIGQDKSSAFAKVVQAAWRNQKTAIPHAFLGRWPVSETAYRVVTFSIQSKGVVPSNCEAPIWLDGWFWDDHRFVDGDPLKVRRLSEMPSTLNWSDAYAAPSWVFYWLFVRIDD